LKENADLREIGMSLGRKIYYRIESADGEDSEAAAEAWKIYYRIESS